MSDSSDSSSLETGVDDLLKHLDEMGKASASKLADKMDVEEGKIKNWGKALEKSNIVEVKYSGLKGMVLKYDSEKSYDEIGEAETMSLTPSNIGEEEDSEEDEEEESSSPTTVHKDITEDEEDEDSEEDEEEEKNIKGNLKAGEVEGKGVNIDVNGSASGGGGGKKDVVDSSEIQESNVVEIENSEIEEMNLGGSKQESDGEDSEERKEVLEEELEELEEKKDEVQEDGNDEEEVVISGEAEKDKEEVEEDVNSELEENLQEDVNSLDMDGEIPYEVGEDFESIVDNINQLVDAIRSGKDDEEVYGRLQEELSQLRDKVDIKDLSDEERKEVIQCMEEAEKEIEDESGGIFSRLKSWIFGSGTSEEVEDVDIEEELDADLEEDLEEEDEETDDALEENENETGDDADEEDVDFDEGLDDIHGDISDLSEEDVDYSPGESLEEILNNVDDLASRLETGMADEQVFEKLDIETDKMKEIIKDKELTNEEQGNVIQIINILEDVLDKKDDKSFLGKIKEAVGGLVP